MYVIEGLEVTSYRHLRTRHINIHCERIRKTFVHPFIPLSVLPIFANQII